MLKGWKKKNLLLKCIKDETFKAGKMKKLFRIVIIVSVAMAVLAAAGCGNKGNSETEPEQPESEVEISGEQKNWGAFQVFIPEGMTLTGGSLIDIEDPNSLWIQPEEFSLDCLQITKTDEASAEKDIKEAKEAYDTSDISKFSAGEFSWTGVSYVSGDRLVQILMGVSGGICVEVKITGYEYDSDMVKSILEGIHILQ